MRSSNRTFLDFKTEYDVNNAIADILVFVFNTSQYKEHIDVINWSAESQVNSNLNLPDGTPSRTLVNFGTSQELSYNLIDDRVALLALSWWTMFISTKDGARMVYFPYTSQLRDSENLKLYPSRNAWFKDEKISNYYKSLQIGTDVVPDVVTMSDGGVGQITINLDILESFLRINGFNFVLWLYNYVKLNNGLVPYDAIDEYISSIDDVPIYRDKTKIDLNQDTPLGKSSTSNVNKNQIDGSTGISQTGFDRDLHSCGLIINTPESREDLFFTLQNINLRLSKKIVDYLPNVSTSAKRVTNKFAGVKKYSSRIIKEAEQVASIFNKIDALVPKKAVSSRSVNENNPSLINDHRKLVIVNEKDLRK